MGRHEPHIVRFRGACEPNVRVEAVEYGDWPDWVAPDFDFETLLARLVASIEARAPEGPLLLAGYSIGGHFVYAAAQALRAAGRTVSFVGILDTNLSRARTPRAAVASRPAMRRGEVRELATAFRHGHAADALARFIIRRLISPRWAPLLRLVARFRHVRLPGDLGFYLHSQLRMTLLTGLVTAWHQQTTAPAQLLPTRVVLFRAEGHPENVPDDHGWREFCADLTIVPVTGDHRSMFDPPHLATLGRRFVDWVRQSRVTTGD
jgi:thioesterase domain-containing protein